MIWFFAFFFKTAKRQKYCDVRVPLSDARHFLENRINMSDSKSLKYMIFLQKNKNILSFSFTYLVILRSFLTFYCFTS